MDWYEMNSMHSVRSSVVRMGLLKSDLNGASHHYPFNINLESGLNPLYLIYSSIMKKMINYTILLSETDFIARLKLTTL